MVIHFPSENPVWRSICASSATMKRLPLLLLAFWFLFEALYSERNIRQGETCTFDWDAYMEQCSKLDTTHGRIASDQKVGEGSARFNFNYTQLRGDTGPLVYPALHTWIHLGLLKAFNWDAVHWTTESTPKDIPGYEQRTHRPNELIATIQRLYLALHLATVAIAAAILVKTGLIKTELVAPPSLKTGPSSSSSSLRSLFRYQTLGQLIPTVIACILLSLSSRVRNVSTTGLFNDTWSMLLAHLAVLLFVSRKWNWGCVVYSASVAVKMNTLLMAPGLLYLLLAEGGIIFALPRLAICAGFQLLVASPFLLTDAKAYLTRAFDLGRAFEQKWSVNWSFLPETVFSSKIFALSLLTLQLALLVSFVLNVWGRDAHPAESRPQKGHRIGSKEEGASAIASSGESGRYSGRLRDRGVPQQYKRRASESPSPTGRTSKAKQVTSGEYGGRTAVEAIASFLLHGRSGSFPPLSAASIAFILYSSNIVGVACARSLHFQFFCWYYHSLPVLLQYSGLPWLSHVVFVVLLEVFWGNHPPQGWSSLGVTALHFLLVGALLSSSVSVRTLSLFGSRQVKYPALPLAASSTTGSSLRSGKGRDGGDGEDGGALDVVVKPLLSDLLFSSAPVSMERAGVGGSSKTDGSDRNGWQD